jgi:energy-coupling factor transport system ATP-binding protein
VALLERLAPGIDTRAHPRDLSEGQRLALVLAVVLTAQPSVICLDEPTRGLDYPGKAALAEILTSLKAEGSAVLVATHDVEFVAQVADRVVVLADGAVVSHGPTARVVAESPSFAPQVHKILGDPWLTVEQVAAVGAET